MRGKARSPGQRWTEGVELGVDLSHKLINPLLKAYVMDPASTNKENPNPYRLGFFLPKTPVLARFPGLAS
jgi:hypothetical protein